LLNKKAFQANGCCVARFDRDGVVTHDGRMQKSGSLLDYYF
jgi:hypothetical protein